MLKTALFILLAYVTTIPAIASAQYHPNKGYAAMKKGTTFVYKSSSGPTSTNRFVGKRGGLYVFEAHTLDGQKPVYTRTIYRNVNGQTVMFERADGAKLKYEPHNCWLVTGKCEYVFYDKNGVPGKYRTNGSYSSRGYTQITEFLDGSKWKPFVKLRATFDSNGLETTRRVQEGAKRTEYKLQKVIIAK